MISDVYSLASSVAGHTRFVFNPAGRTLGAAGNDFSCRLTVLPLRLALKKLLCLRISPGLFLNLSLYVYIKNPWMIIASTNQSTSPSVVKTTCSITRPGLRLYNLNVSVL